MEFGFWFSVGILFHLGKKCSNCRSCVKRGRLKGNCQTQHHFFSQGVQLLWKKLMFLPCPSLIQPNTLVCTQKRWDSHWATSHLNTLRVPGPSITGCGVPYLRGQAMSVPSLQSPEGMVWPLQQCSQTGSDGGKYMEVLVTLVAGPP